MLAQEGILVDVPFVIIIQGTEQLADYLKLRIEAAADSSIDAYHC